MCVISLAPVQLPGRLGDGGLTLQKYDAIPLEITLDTGLRLTQHAFSHAQQQIDRGLGACAVENKYVFCS